MDPTITCPNLSPFLWLESALPVESQELENGPEAGGSPGERAARTRVQQLQQAVHFLPAPARFASGCWSGLEAF